MSFKTIAGGFNGTFWWYGPLSEDRERKEKQNKTIIVALNFYNSKGVHWLQSVLYVHT